MYIQEAHITKFGILENQEMIDIPPSLIVIHGANEAGKSTLLNFFRCMIADLPPRRNNEHYKAIPTIDQGFSGKIRVMPSSMDNKYLEIYKKYTSDSKNKNIITLSDSFGKTIDMALWRHMLGSAIDIAVYKNIFGISLSELTAVTEGNIKDALYGASIGMGARSPREVLSLLDTRSDTLYKPKGSNPTINKLLVDLARVEEDRFQCLAIMEQYESLQMKSKALSEKIQDLDKEIKEIQENVSLNQKFERAWESYKSALIIKKDIEVLPAYSGITKSLQRDFEHFYKEEQDAKESLILLTKKKEELVSTHSVLSVDENILKNMYQIHALLEKKSQYQSVQEALQKIQRSTQTVYENIDAILSELGAEWNNERIQKIDTSFAMEKEISKKEQRLRDHDAGVYHKSQNLEDIQNGRKRLEKELYANKEENEYVLELPVLEENIEKIQAKHQEYKYKERDIATIQYSIEREVAAMYPTWTTADAEQCFLGREDTIYLRSLTESYAMRSKKWSTLDEKIKRCKLKCSDYTEELEKNKEVLEQYREGNTTKDLETLELLESLIQVKEQMSTASDVIHKVRYFVWIPLLIVAFFAIVYFIRPEYLMLSSVVAGVSLISSVFCTYFIYTVRISIKKQLASLEIEEIKNSSQLEKEILICSVALELSNIRRGTIQKKKALLLENKEVNSYHKFYKERSETLRKLLYQQEEEFDMLCNEINDEEVIMRELRYKWKQRLDALNMPVLEISIDALHNFSERLKDIHELFKQNSFGREDLSRVRFIRNDLKKIVEETASYKSIVYMFDAYEDDIDYFLQEMKKYIKNLQEIAKHKWGQEQEYKKLSHQAEILEKDIPDMKDSSTAIVEWKKWLVEQGYPDDITPEIVREYCKQIRKIKEYNKSLESLSREEKELKNFLLEFTTELQRYIAMLPNTLKETIKYKDSISCLESLCRYLKEEEDKYRIYNEMLEKKQHYSEEITVVQERIERISMKMQDIFHETKTSSVEELRNTFELFEKYNEKMETIERFQQIVKEIVHPLSLEDVDLYFASHSFEDLASLIQESLHTIDSLNMQRVDLAKECGILSNQIVQAEKGGINIHNIEYAMITTEIKKYTTEWMHIRVAKEMILQAKKQLEDNKQPFVMEMASDFMKEITGGRWNRILRSTEGDIILSNNKGVRTTPELLSRGAQEQAYFALRLAGACNHATITKESLPLLFDDITVNFDPKRAEKMAQLVCSIAKGDIDTIPQHQVFLFTCHDSVVNMFKNMMPEAQFFSLKSGVLATNEALV